MAPIALDVAALVSIWAETLFYGIYCCLFAETMYVVLRKKKTRTVSAKVFFYSMIVMFTLSTVHMGINVYRMLRAYVWLASDPGPAVYVSQLQRWDNVGRNSINAFITWMGDALIIYRCFLVWGQNYYVVALPLALLVVSIVSNSIALSRFGSGGYFSPAIKAWVDVIYAGAFVQNTLTTCLIAYRIWRHDRQTSGFIGKGANLMPIARIVVESALLYLLEVLALMILYALNNNGQFIVQEMFVPTVGIVFCLITVRTTMHASPTLKPTQRATTGPSIHLTNLLHPDSVGDSTDNAESPAAFGVEDGEGVDMAATPPKRKSSLGTIVGLVFAKKQAS